MTSRNDYWGALLLSYNGEHPLSFPLVYQEEYWLSFLSYRINRQLLLVSSYRTDQQPLSVSSNYKYKRWPLPFHLVNEHQRWPGLSKNTMRKLILDYPVDVKPFLHKELNEPNIPQELDFILACEPDQKLSSPPAAERPTTKTTLADEQKRIALLAKDP